jgi:NosR/NirI family transcriptional regulator, nitrous oxide reductase regulator
MSAVRAQTPIQQRQAIQRRRRNLITLLAFLILIGAWIFGFVNTGDDVSAYVADVLPEAERIQPGNGGVFTGYRINDAGEEIVVGYALAAQATGYGGPLAMMVGTDPDGTITGITVIEHRETPNFFRQLERQGFYDQFLDADYTRRFYVGEDLDGVSGATLSAEAVASSIRQATRGIASDAVEGAVLPPEQRPIRFGAPEIVLLGLFVVSFFLHRVKRRPSLKKWGRWTVLLTGLIVLGFIFNKPLTLANIIALLAGYWPDWHNNIYWFLLLGGILLVTSIQGKNPYCSWFCPFGAAQEVLGTLSGAKAYQPRNLYDKLRWVQRSLAFTAIVLGLALRQPGAASYEPFGTLFNLEGTWPQWALLILVLFGSLVIYRPFCNYLCPLDPVVDYIGEVRRWVKNVWQQRSKTAVSISDS